MTDRVKRARELFLDGYNCSQAVLGAFCDEIGMDFNTAMKLSSSFGGGMGRMREVCGACSAMFMIAGIIYGYDDSKDDKKKAAHYALIQKLAEDFKAQNGTIICRELLRNIKTDMSANPTKRDNEFYKKRPCLKFVEDAASIVESLLNREKAV